MARREAADAKRQAQVPRKHLYCQNRDNAINCLIRSHVAKQPELLIQVSHMCTQLTYFECHLDSFLSKFYQSLGDALEEKDAFLQELKALNRQMFASREEANAKLSAFEARMAEVSIAPQRENVIS